MTKTSLFTVIVLLGLCSFTAVANLSKDLQLQLSFNIFKDWTTKYNKQYGIEEMAVRFYNWKSNFDLVQEHNAQALDWELGMNDFGDATPEEFSALHLGFNADLQAAFKNRKKDDNSTDNDNDSDDDGTTLLGSSANSTNATLLALPKSVDWRTKGAVTPVRNQGRCGGCYSFAAGGALEGLYAIKNNKLINLSVQQVIDCSGGNYGNLGCDGGLMVTSFEYTKKHGIATDSVYEYKAAVGKCKQDPKKAVFKNKGYKEVPSNNSMALKKAVAKQPVAVAMEASTMTVQLYKKGVISSGCGTALDHAVLIVGYDKTKSGQEYWIVKNSWGTEWGNKGYMNIAMGSQNKGAGICGINIAASYPTI